MVRLVVTDRIRSAIELFISDTKADVTLAEELRPFAKNRSDGDERPDENEEPVTIQHGLLNKLSIALLEGEGASRQEFYLHSLIRGSSIFMDRPKPRTKSPELIKLLDTIRADLANKEYAEMVKGVSAHGNVRQVQMPVGGELRDAFRQLSAVVNVLFSVIAVFVAVYWVSGTVTTDVAFRTLISFFSAIVVAIAEGWFFARDWLFDEPAPSTQHVIGKKSGT